MDATDHTAAPPACVASMHAPAVGSIFAGLQRPSGLNAAAAAASCQVVRREQLRHEVDLLDADAVFAGHAAAQADALVQDLVTRLQHPPHLIRVALVEEQDRVDVAVAGVEDVAIRDRIFADPGMKRMISGSFVRGTTPSCVQ